ncbi:hypothetical protein [Pseudoalteromonas gelatinilytica]
MQIPSSFNTQNRAELNTACRSISIVALNSYQTSHLITAAAGSALLANAIKDTTRQQRPEAFNAVVLSCSASTAAELASKLNEFNQHCPIAVFTHAQAHAKSLSTIDTDKMRLPTTEQSIEWQYLDNCCALVPIAHAFTDKSKQLVADEGVELISDIDTELANAEQLKTIRDQRLSQTTFETGANLTVTLSSAQSARGLSQQIETLGNNDKHWAYCVFVGSNESIQTIKELFA